ncbi:MAG: hypothetical protein R3318_07565 [Gammaproteobacteria bacterium]|nr:hypothetical protein [Gammaproteobacteria bacterium]
MKQGNVEWPAIRGAVIVFCIILLISGGMIGATLYFKHQVQLEFNRNKAMFQSISQRYLAVDQEENMIHEYYPKYVELLEQGIIGRERRLNWIEVLRAFGEETRVPMLNYRISSQNEHPFEYPVDMGQFRIYSSSMKLDLKLLHEGDLINLLNTIETNSLGLSSVDQCKLRRSRNKTVFDVNKPNLEASCEINWFTIKKSDGTDLTT